MRVLLVDDEAPARDKMRRLLAAEADVEVAGEAANGAEAIDAIRRGGLDLVFLDIQMPRGGGFEVVEAIGVGAMPPVVFVTAFDQHALRAFEIHALDYLLKPYAPSRLRQVLDRARRRLKDRAAADLAQRLERALAAASDPAPAPTSAAYLRRIQVRLGEDREAFLALGDVRFVRSQGNYLHFHGRDGEVYRRRGTLSDLAQRLDPDDFLRINRSEIVRLDAVAELQPWFHGDYRVQLEDGTVLSWSRRYRAKVKDSL
ncbi:MAG: LytTR family DNA-binding domain-containing protein [Acidobacteriota bacterium]